MTIAVGQTINGSAPEFRLTCVMVGSNEMTRTSHSQQGRTTGTPSSDARTRPTGADYASTLSAGLQQDERPPWDASHQDVTLHTTDLRLPQTSRRRRASSRTTPPPTTRATRVWTYYRPNAINCRVVATSVRHPRLPQTSPAGYDDSVI